MTAQLVAELPGRLRAYRQAHNVSLRQVAEATGLNIATVHRIESGRDYRVSSLIAVAHYLDQETAA
jgi:transcriptional regulator with XRE-family HTH domain